jgi:hypothetical protein
MRAQHNSAIVDRALTLIVSEALVERCKSICSGFIDGFKGAFEFGECPSEPAHWKVSLLRCTKAAHSLARVASDLHNLTREKHGRSVCAAITRGLVQ